MPAPLVLPAPSPPAPTTTQGSTFSTPPHLAWVRAVGVCVWARVSAATRHSWGVLVWALRLHPATPGLGARRGCVCLGSGFGCTPPLLACASVGAPLAPRHSWLGCAPWLCVFGLGFRLLPLVSCGALLGLVARGCLLVPCCGALLFVFICPWCWFVSFPRLCGAVLRCASCCSAPVESALLSVPRAVACLCVLWCPPGRSAVWWCRSGVSSCLAVLCVVLWCAAPCAVSCGAVLPCGVVLVGCAVRLSALLVFVLPFILLSFAKNPCCFSVPLKMF